MPTFPQGATVSIRKEKEGKEFDIFQLYNYREQIAQKRKAQTKGKLPLDIYIKSYNDLIQSITSACSNEDPFNWILCEGVTEKIYIEHHFKEKLIEKKIRILPLGGKNEIKKVYDRLLIPMSDADYEIKGKVICFMDTDTEDLSVAPTSSKNIKFYRLLNNESTLDAELILVSDNKKSPPTSIEDALSPQEFVSALVEIAQEEQDTAVASILDNIQFNANGKSSHYYLDLRTTESLSVKNLIMKPGVKYKLAQSYINKATTPPSWMEKLISEF